MASPGRLGRDAGRATGGSCRRGHPPHAPPARPRLDHPCQGVRRCARNRTWQCARHRLTRPRACGSESTGGWRVYGRCCADAQAPRPPGRAVRAGAHHEECQEAMGRGASPKLTKKEIEALLEGTSEKSLVAKKKYLLAYGSVRGVSFFERTLLRMLTPPKTGLCQGRSLLGARNSSFWANRSLTAQLTSR